MYSNILTHYIKIDGKWHRKLCDECLTPVQRINQQKCSNCVVRYKPANCVHDRSHSAATKRIIANKKSKTVIGYNGLHNWLRREFGRAYKCDNQNCESKSNYFDWACISTYEKKRENFIQLCRSCHKRYDTKKMELAL